MNKLLATIVSAGVVLGGLVVPCKAQGSEVYAVVSAASYHFDRSKKRNEQNWGAGFEVGVAQDLRLAAGMYRNSNYIDSTYFGGAWTPLKLGDFRLGAFAGGFTGYDIDIKWGLLPVLTWERGRLGANLTLAPTQGDEKSSAVLGLQLKYQLR